MQDIIQLSGQGALLRYCPCCGEVVLCLAGRAVKFSRSAFEQLVGQVNEVKGKLDELPQLEEKYGWVGQRGSC